MACKGKRRFLNASGLFHILLAGRLVLADEVLGGVAAEPAGELDELLAEPVDGLLVHVGLGDQFGEGYCGVWCVSEMLWG